MPLRNYNKADLRAAVEVDRVERKLLSDFCTTLLTINIYN